MLYAFILGILLILAIIFRISKGLAIGLGILILVAIILPFTQFGNNLIKPYAQTYIKEKTGFDVNFDKFRIGFDSANLSGVINNEISFDTNSTYSLASQNFDLVYKLKAVNFKDIKLKNEINLSGAANGNIKNFIVNAIGYVAGSNARFSARVINFNLKEIKANAKGLDIAELFVIANKKPYLNGKIDIIAGSTDLNQSKANIKIINAVPNRDLIQKDLNLTLPDLMLLVNSDLNVQNEFVVSNNVVKLNDKSGLKVVDLTLNLDLNMKSKNAMIKADGKINNLFKAKIPQINFSLYAKPILKNSIIDFTSTLNSNLANLTKFDGSYDIDKNEFKADYALEISDLGKIDFLTIKHLYGSLIATGSIKKDKNLSANITSDMLNSKLEANLRNDDFNLKMNKFSTQSLLKMLGYSDFYSGLGNMVFNYNIKNKTGNFDINVTDGSLTRSILTEALSIVLKRDILNSPYNNGFIRGEINAEMINFNAMLESPKSKIQAKNANLNLNTSAINIPIKADAYGNDVEFIITGSTQNPQYKISQKYVQKKLVKEIKNGINNLLNNDKDSNKDVIKGIKNIFGF